MGASIAVEAAGETERDATRPGAGRWSPVRRRALVLAAVVILGAVGASWWRSSSPADQRGALADVERPADGVVTQYSVTYRTVFTDVELDELVQIARPFHSRIESKSSVQVSGPGFLATSSDASTFLRIAVPISVAAGDLRPFAAIDEVLDAGGATIGRDDTIQGRPCRRYELGGPVSSGSFTAIGAVPGESAEVCIDELGIVLWESWTIDGEVIRTREAISISFEEIDPTRFELPAGTKDLPFDDGGGAVRPVDPTADPGFVEYWELSSVPDGFEHVDRWAVVPPMIDARPDDGTPRVSDLALVTDAWQRGPDLLLVDQGAGRNGVGPPWDDDDASSEVDLGVLGTGQVVADLQMSEVRVVRPEGGFVRVAGTLAPAELVAIARSLQLR